MQSEILSVPNELKIITKSEVIEDFENLINPYCEQYEILYKVPKTTICNIMVKLFRGKTEHRDEWIRKQIDNKFKSAHRVRNAQKRKSFESTIADIATESIKVLKK